ncbi:unnamed protein product [Cylicocyclus nassatus]|uniref:EGF-like domain-containing protein n=1 Tax=Cylicocyclus nassatus TaxID=53992 RepID=A0AA36HGM1_CYLNA|nr:unnamed protein product [Cylicocyclus nassatus]
MRELLAVAVIITYVIASDVGLNLPCNREMDGLLAADPDGNPTAFLSCQSNGAGLAGFWERRVCPDGMVFDFINQQCLQRKHRKQPLLNIAILNNSCAHGETCIGGTVCDLERLRCLCPYGSVPQLETLSCLKPKTSFNSFGSFGNFEKPVPTPGVFLPNPGHTNPPPFTFNFSPLFNKETNPNMNFGNQNNQNKQSSSNSGSAGEQNSYPNNNYGNNVQWSKIGAGKEISNAGVYQPNGFAEHPKPAGEPYVFQPNIQNLYATTTQPPQTKKVPQLARPGQSCRENEICIGGSICTLPIALCLCPGELEEKDGECVLPPSASIPIEKVGIGAQCSELAECDNGSTCVMGRCVCVPPLIQHEDRCLLRQERKEVGPGELCDNGETCVRGSVCDSVIPVCVCPPNTDLYNGDCVPISSIKDLPRRPIYISPPTPQPSQTQPASQLPAQPQPAFTQSTTLAPVYVPPTTQQAQQPAQPSPFGGQYGQNNNFGKSLAPAVYTAQPVQVTTYSHYQSTMPPPTVKPTSKPNYMKLSLGGSKQAGVGVPCSLNTDCMIGAYCNGNTNPPSCQCLSTHVNIEGRCERVVYPGQVGCRSDLQCSAAYTGTKCVDRICVCPEGYKEVDQTCVPESEPVTSPPGGACTDNRICVGGSVCREGWCICPDPNMIVQRGICIQSGPRPTVPPANGGGISMVPNFNHLSTAQGRKIPPNSSCGPLDTCVGGATCIDGLCVCPPGMQASAQGRCERSPTGSTTPMVLKPGTPTYARPGQACTNGETCLGGSICKEMMVCACPPEKPILLGDTCTAQQYKKIATPGESCDENTECTKESTCQGGQCRCQYGYIAVSGQCVALPMPTTPTMKNVVLAKPLDSCDNGEQCEGGSSCDQDTGVCMCPPGYIVYGVQCQAPPESTQGQTFITPTPQAALVHTNPIDSASPECVDDTNCGPNKVCVVERCKCKPGFVDHDGVCEPLEQIELGERPVPVSFAKHKVETLSSERLVDQVEYAETTVAPIVPSPRTPSRQETQRPRIVGPPIRRPKPKTKSTSITSPGSYKTTSTASGACPPGNEPTRDENGRIIVCNGLEPNCPPRSYCYITTGGFATEEYNCCKSW